MAGLLTAAFEQTLSSVDLRARVTRRHRLGAEGILPLAPGTTAFVYLLDGTIENPSSHGPGCTVTPEAGRIDIHPLAPPLLHAGDAFLTMGRQKLAIRAQLETELVVTELEFLEGMMLTGRLPDIVSVSDFAGEEPSAAALAGTMGVESGCTERYGDSLICATMAKTIVLSILRAWVERGCAPEGWPTLSSDPFLDRVVTAIHSAPGRDWTVESLASIGAMSRSVFAERFRNTIGRSPASYVTGVRMDLAKRMLEAGRSVAETSRELGYGSDEGFSRAFRRHTGLAPSLWQGRMHATEALSA